VWWYNLDVTVCPVVGENIFGTGLNHLDVLLDTTLCNVTTVKKTELGLHDDVVLCQIFENTFLEYSK
jgi:hypothetical protein